MSGIPAGSPPGEPGGKPAQTATRVFVDHRGLLFSIVYNMLGSVADTEDVLQETWLAWVARTQAASGELITSPRAYLVRIAVNRALACQASISGRREDYTGPWLPEPLITEDQAGDSAETVVRAESVSIAPRTCPRADGGSTIAYLRIRHSLPVSPRQPHRCIEFQHSSTGKRCSPPKPACECGHSPASKS